MPTPQRLPIVNSDDGVWGDILRQYLAKEHTNDDTDNPLNGGHKNITIIASAGTAGTAPIRFTSGTKLSSTEDGAMEYDGSYYYLTSRPSGSNVRKRIAVYDETGGATGDMYYRDASGYFTKLAIGSTNDLLTVTGGVPAWTSTATVGSATKLQTARTIGGVSFDGTANINLPGVNTGGNQNTTGSAASLTTARNFRTNLASTSTASFNGTADVNPGVTGTLPVANGGTGATTLTGIVKGNGTSAMTAVTAPSGALVGTTDSQVLTNKTISGADNTITNIPMSAIGTGKVSGSANGTPTSLTLWKGTQAQYNAIVSKDSNTVYIVTS